MVRVLILFFLVCGSAVEAMAQGAAWVMMHPEALAGTWEGLGGEGWVVGMNIYLTTLIDGRPVVLEGKPQSVEQFMVALFRRRLGEALGDRTDMNFVTVEEAGTTSWDGHRLQMHLVVPKGDPVFQVDLSWDERGGTWTGVIERHRLRSVVVLRRPSSAAGSRFAGAWFVDRGEWTKGCLHLGAQEDGGLAAWFDDLQNLSRMRYANHIEPEKRTWEQYGKLASVEMLGPGEINVDLGLRVSACCSPRFSLRMAKDGRTMAGILLSGGGAADTPSVWRRMKGDSCLVAAGLREARVGR